MGRLTDRTIKSAAAGRYGDGGGLLLVVSSSGRRKWILRFQINGSRRDMGLGSYPHVSLAEARIAAGDARKLIVQGEDPVEARKTGRKKAKPIPTFGDVAKLVIADAQAKSTNAKVRYQWERHLGPFYSGPLLSRPVNEITTLEVAAVLKSVWRDKPEVARKLYPAIRRVFEYARIHLRDNHGVSMPDNPARWSDLKAMNFEPPRKLSRGSHPALNYSELPDFVADLRMRGAMAAKALELLILTNVRTGVVLMATWDEFDLDRAVWVIPLANLKDRAHRKEPMRVPLSNRAIEILSEIKTVKTSKFVFPAHRADRSLSNMAMLTLLRRMNRGPSPKWIDPVSKRQITAHGFRATFRTWAEEATGFPHAVIEEAMGHQIGTIVERVYRRTDVLAKRRELMQAWAAWCEPRAHNVVALGRPAAS